MLACGLKTSIPLAEWQKRELDKRYEEDSGGNQDEKITEEYENNLKKDLLDPIEAAEYLTAALEDGDQEIFFMAFKDVASAKGIS